MSMPLFIYYIEHTTELIKDATSISNNNGTCTDFNISLMRDKLIESSSIIGLIQKMVTENRKFFYQFHIDVIGIVESMIRRLTQSLINNKCNSRSNITSSSSNNSNSNSNSNNSSSSSSSNISNSNNYLQIEPYSHTVSPINGLKATDNVKLFKDIAGNQIAKQVLWENIIMPFLLPVETAKFLFVGIRKMFGHVLLYGPPGSNYTNT